MAPSVAEARTALGILERGVAGIVLRGGDAAAVRQVAALVKAAGEKIALRPAKVV